MKSFFTALLVVAAAMPNAFAAEKMSPKKDLKTNPEVTKLDVTGEIKWTGYGVGKQHHGTLALKSGVVEFKKNQLADGTFFIDMATLKTSDSPKLEAHLRSEDFFNVEKFKEATFKITKVEKLKPAAIGDATHKITGELTIKGKTEELSFDAVISEADKKFTAVAKAQIADRTKFDIVYNSAKFKAASLLGNKLIEDKIDIELSLKTQ